MTIPPDKRGGRPSAYREEYCEQARKLALLGLTDAEMAGIFGVSEVTLNAWKQRYPQFLKSLIAGKIVADGAVAASMYERACGYSHEAVKIFMPAGASDPVYAPYTEHYPPDTAAASLWLRNRQPAKWRDKTEVDLTLNKPVEEISDEELARIAATGRVRAVAPKGSAKKP